MIKTIAYGGHSANPSDYASVDGDLSLSMGVINEDGALRPIAHPKQELTFPEGSKVMHIHETSRYRNFIFVRAVDNSTEGDDEASYHYFLCWRDSKGNDEKIRDFGTCTISNVKSIGNTLVVLAEDGIHYALWKAKGENYHYLGTSIPELSLSFGLVGSMVESDREVFAHSTKDINRSVSIASLGNAIKKSTSNAEEQKAAKEKILATANKLIAEKVTGKGKFCFPFFVRYAYRLYDQTLICQSAPVLMYASNPELSAIFVSGFELHKPNVDTTSDIWRRTRGKYRDDLDFDEDSRASFWLGTSACELDYSVKEQEEITALKDWRDVIDSIDIFISAPIYNYDQDGELILDEGNTWLLNNLPSGYQYMIGRGSSGSVPMDGRNSTLYRRRRFGWWTDVDMNGGDTQTHNYVYELTRNTQYILNDITDCHLFYHVKSIQINDLATERTLIKIDHSILESLQAREVMTDDYGSHDAITARDAISYNNRVSLYDVKKTLFEGFAPLSLFSFTNGKTPEIENYTGSIEGVFKRELVQIMFLTKEDGKRIDLAGEENTFGLNTPYSYAYFPNANAYVALIKISYEDSQEADYYEVPLKKHDYLNGAYFYGNWRDEKYKQPSIEMKSSSVEERTVLLPNRIYTSLVNNPFSFPASLVTSVGANRVVALAIANQAMSPSQFGQHPMYAFTEEGVWALGVTSEGAFTPAQPVTNDILTNEKGILALDNSVIYSTARGLMLLSGSQPKCISDRINSTSLFSVADLPRYEALLRVFARPSKGVSFDHYGYGDKFYQSPNGALVGAKMLPFLEFIKDSELLYDYVHQHVLMFRKDTNYGYAYSLKSGEWGMIPTIDFLYVVPSENSHAYAMFYIDAAEPDEGEDSQMLLDYGKESNSYSGAIRSLVITRPIKLDDPFDFQTISTIIQRGQFERNAVQQVLYGTNDYEHWFVVWSSKDKYMRGFSGSPYKAYRIVFMATMRPSDNIYGATIEYKPKLTNKPR